MFRISWLPGSLPTRSTLVAQALSLGFFLAFLAANLVPQIRFGIPVFLSPGSGIPVTTPAEYQWGWPLVVRKDVGTVQGARKDLLRNPRYSLEPITGGLRLTPSQSRYSVVAGLGNVASLVSGLVLLVILARATLERKFVLRSMLLGISCVAVWIATFTWESPLAGWDPLLFDAFGAR